MDKSPIIKEGATQVPGVVFEKKKISLKEFLAIDWRDVWNWVFLIIAIFLLWWGVGTIIKVMMVKP